MERSEALGFENLSQRKADTEGHADGKAKSKVEKEK
jgi:hypothetical protein